MIYQTTSSKAVIAKVFRDFGIQRSDWINDAIEWIGEALELIGTSRQTVPKVRKTKVYSWKTPIPSDMYILDTVRYADDTGSKSPDLEDFKYIASEGDMDKFPGLFREDDTIYRRATEKYFIDGSFIKFTFEDKWVALEYKAFPLDEDGYPLVPDAAEFKEALAWYIIWKIILRGKQHPVINYEIARREWKGNMVRARNSYNMPDKGQMRDFRDRWVSMIPRYDRSMEQLEEAVTAENVVSKSYAENIIG